MLQCAIPFGKEKRKNKNILFKVSSKIWTIKGKNPCAIYVQDGSVKCIIEENKIKNPIDFIKAMFRIKECKITELENDNILREIPHPYYGLSYDKHSILGLVQSSGSHYELYIHNPDDPRFSTPSKFFNRVASLIKDGKKVGWFQNKWSILNSLDSVDLNRCILRKRFISKVYGPYMQKLIENNNLFFSLTNKLGYIPTMNNLNAYNPQQAIDKLKKEKIIDVLVIANIIVARKKEDLEV